MPTKAQLETAFKQVACTAKTCIQAESQADFKSAVEAARSSITYLADAMRYQRKYGDDPKARLLPITIILHYAPPFFLYKPLIELSEWWHSLTKTERLSCAEISPEISTGHTIMAHASALWADACCSVSPIPKPTGGRGGAIVELWIRAGLAIPIQPRLFTLVTHLHRHIEAKCNQCGNSQYVLLDEAIKSLHCNCCSKCSNFTVIKRYI